MADKKKIVKYKMTPESLTDVIGAANSNIQSPENHFDGPEKQKSPTISTLSNQGA